MYGPITEQFFNVPDITNSKELRPAYTQLLADKPKAKTKYYITISELADYIWL